MKGLIRGVASAAVVLGATACADDYSIDFGGAPTGVQISPEVMFVNSGANKEVLVRLVNDRNQSTPTSFTLGSVEGGITVTYDDQYRPQWTSTDPNLEAPLVKEQQRYIVAANLPTGGKRTFQLSSSGLTGTATVYVLPTSLGPALSATAPALGDPVTINAPDGQSFSTTSSVSFPAGGAPIIQERTAKSITFIPRPGTNGPATVDGITLDYAPTLASRSLTTSNEIDVEAIESIPATYSTSTPGLFAEVTVNAPTGFRFLPNFRMALGQGSALTVSVAADSRSAVVILPSGASGIPTFSNFVLSFLTEVPVANVPGITSITTPNEGWLDNDFDPGVRTIAANAPGTPARFYGSWNGSGAGDILGLGGTTRIWRLSQAAAGSRTYQVNWTADAAGVNGDVDMGIVDDAITVYLALQRTANKPESATANLGAGNFWLATVLWEDANPPGLFWWNIN